MRSIFCWAAKVADKICSQRLMGSFAVAGILLAGCESQTVLNSAVENQSVYVNGSGSVTAVADMANINVGVETFSERADDAVAKNSEQTSAVIAAVKSHGVAAKDIQTSSFSLYSQKDYDRGNVPEVVGYWVNNSVSIVLRDLASSGQVLQAAIDAGANNVNGLFLTVSNADELRQDARSQAVADAKIKAQILAEAAGKRLGGVTSMRELSGSTPVYSRAEFAADAAIGVEIEPGELVIAVQVEVVFELL